MNAECLLAVYERVAEAAVGFACRSERTLET